ncbi:MAG: hypothetical protein ABUT39_18110 [Acidobacteriota bacterium]
MEIDRILALDYFLQGRLRLIEKLYQELGSPSLETASQEDLVVVECRLEGLYSAFESLFQRVSFDFRLLVPVTRRPLLDRMRMDHTPVRPAVIGGEVFEKLFELHRFRRRFRLRYERPLQAPSVEPVLRKALELRTIYRPQIEAFLDFLRRVR